LWQVNKTTSVFIQVYGKMKLHEQVFSMSIDLQIQKTQLKINEYVYIV
jgi:hypothetical protein